MTRQNPSHIDQNILKGTLSPPNNTLKVKDLLTARNPLSETRPIACRPRQEAKSPRTVALSLMPPKPFISETKI